MKYPPIATKNKNHYIPATIRLIINQNKLYLIIVLYIYFISALKKTSKGINTKNKIQNRGSYIWVETLRQTLVAVIISPIADNNNRQLGKKKSIKYVHRIKYIIKTRNKK